MPNPDASPPPLLITSGRVIDPDRRMDAVSDVLIAGGQVVAIGRAADLGAPPDTRRIDAEGCLVTPGLIDPHVHLREPGEAHEETIATGSAGAVAGGFTTVCCMPNTTPPLDTPDCVRGVHAQADAAAGARVLVAACATVGRRGEQPADIRALTDAGAAAFTDDGDCVASAGVMQAVLQAVAAADRPFMQHCQDPTLTMGAAMNAGAVAEELGLVGWPAVAEEIIIERDVRLNGPIGARYHAQHLSSGGSVEIIRRARAAGQPVSGEVSPHHLLLTDEACRTLGPAAKMNPPLRTAADIALLKEGVADGTITVLATDHAPHPMTTKERPFSEAAFGIVGLECALPLYIRALIDDGVIGWPRLVAMMTIVPADLLGGPARSLGRLAPGGPGDVTIIDPDLEWTIDVSAFASAGRNCPFDGWTVHGRAIATIVAGHLLLDRTGDRAEKQTRRT